MGADQQRTDAGLPRARVLSLALGVTITVIAWGVLVFAAIDFGRTARDDGGRSDWAMLGLATVGAVACMFLAIVLASKLLGLLRGASGRESPPQPPAPGPPPGEPAAQLPRRPHSHAQEHGRSAGPRPKGAPAGGKRAAR